MTIEESISIQQQIADPKISIEEAVRLLMKKSGLSEPRARHRVFSTRGRISEAPRKVEFASVELSTSSWFVIDAGKWKVVQTRTSQTKLYGRREFIHEAVAAAA